MLRSALVLGLCVFLGFWAFVYQGYREDAGTDAVTTWPWGAALYGAAVLIALRMVRLQSPAMPGWRLARFALLFALIALLAAFVSLGAGQGSPLDFL